MSLLDHRDFIAQRWQQCFPTHGQPCVWHHTVGGADFQFLVLQTSPSIAGCWATLTNAERLLETIDASTLPDDDAQPVLFSLTRLKVTSQGLRFYTDYLCPDEPPIGHAVALIPDQVPTRLWQLTAVLQCGEGADVEFNPFQVTVADGMLERLLPKFLTPGVEMVAEERETFADLHRLPNAPAFDTAVGAEWLHSLR